MCEPLPVAGPGGGPDAAAMDVREVQRETRVPAPPVFSMCSADVTGILDRRAKARRTHHGAVGACKAAHRDIVPTWVFEVLRERFFDTTGVNNSGLMSCRIRGRLGIFNILFASRFDIEFSKDGAAANRA